MIVLGVQHLILAEIFLLRKAKAGSVGEDTCLKALRCGLSSCPLWHIIKNCPFLVLNKKY